MKERYSVGDSAVMAQLLRYSGGGGDYCHSCSDDESSCSGGSSSRSGGNGVQRARFGHCVWSVPQLRGDPGNAESVLDMRSRRLTPQDIAVLTVLLPCQRPEHHRDGDGTIKNNGGGDEAAPNETEPQAENPTLPTLQVTFGL